MTATRRPFAALYFIFAIAVCGAAGLTAQAADDPALADFEAALFAEGGPDAAAPEAPAPAAQEEAKTEVLFGGSFLVQADAFLALNGSWDLLASMDATGKVFTKVSIPRYGALFASVAIGQTLFQGYTGDTLFPPDDPYVPDLDLSEFHYSFDIAKRLFVRLGNQLVAWGPAQIWTPVDFINREKTNSLAQVDTRVGKPSLRLHLILPFGNLFGFFDFAPLFEGASQLDPLQNVNLGGRLDWTLAGFEFGLSGYGGVNAQARLGADLTGRLLGMTVWLEAAWAPEYSAWDNELLVSAGLSRRLDDKGNWTLTLEGFYNSAGADYSIYTFATLPEDIPDALYQGIWYAYVSVRATDFLANGLDTTLSALVNITELSYSIRLAEALDLPGLPPCTITAGYAGGGENKEFTRYAGGNALTLTVNTRLEF